MEKLTEAPNITRVVHQITLQIVEIDNNPKNLSVVIQNPDALPSDVVVLMLGEAAKLVKQLEKHHQRKGGTA